jgi:hypothetical protein
LKKNQSPMTLKEIEKLWLLKLIPSLFKM